MFTVKLFARGECIEEKPFPAKANAIAYAQDRWAEVGGKVESAIVRSPAGELIWCESNNTEDPRHARWNARWRDGRRELLDGSTLVHREYPEVDLFREKKRP
jgi:hypothetical protein